MSREIKFRARQIDNDKWVTGFIERPHSTDTEDGVKSYYFQSVDERGWYSQVIVNANTISQYTGLKDKNDVEIYEGDIVKHDFGAEQIGIQYAVVVYDTKYACFQIVPINDWMYCDKSDCEVVGNIYENADLLKSAN